MATLVPFVRERADRLLETYLGPDQDEWPDMFFDLPPEDYPLIRFEAEMVVARDQSYRALPGVREGNEILSRYGRPLVRSW